MQWIVLYNFNISPRWVILAQIFGIFWKYGWLCIFYFWNFKGKNLQNETSLRIFTIPIGKYRSFSITKIFVGRAKMKVPWRCQVERTLHPFINYRNWDIDSKRCSSWFYHNFVYCVRVWSRGFGVEIVLVLFLWFDL